MAAIIKVQYCLVIYDRPDEFPTEVITALHLLALRGDKVQTVPTGLAWHHESIDEARRHLPRGAVCFGRNPGDDPAIVETWGVRS